MGFVDFVLDFVSYEIDTDFELVNFEMRTPVRVLYAAFFKIETAPGTDSNLFRDNPASIVEPSTP
jgi:hypothetical protein